MKFTFPRIFLFLFWIHLSPFSLPSLHSQTVSALQLEIKKLKNDPALAHTHWGICVMDAESGKLLAEHHAQHNLTTASTMKALTTATALSMLGPDHTFTTKIEYAGKLQPDGTLIGDLFIRGSGDPSLGSNRFSPEQGMERVLFRWAEIIKASGIARIQGRIIGDATAFDSQLTPGDWGWADMGNYYGAGAAGLNMAENTYRIVFKPGAYAGAKTSVIKTVPFIEDILFSNEVLTGKVGSGDNAYIYGAPYTNLRYLRGTIPAGVSSFTIKGSVPDPSLFAARMLKEALAEQQVVTSGKATTVRQETIKQNALPTDRKLIYTHFSPKLKDIVKETNVWSINMYAEALLKALPNKQRKRGSTSRGISTLTSYWKSEGVDVSTILIKDGSGLSANNSVSPYAMAHILSKVYQSPVKESFFASLPVAGRSGTLKRTGKGTYAEGRVHAKSGSIANVRAYTGYVKSVGGNTLAFAIMFNQYDLSYSQVQRRIVGLMDRMARLNKLSN
ncbi:MAG: D-alanyl-D-alanine carboxypeptidase/D-alanyl-D-alanine-endopeptidase [Bacteroidota bacterium]